MLIDTNKNKTLNFWTFYKPSEIVNWVRETLITEGEMKRYLEPRKPPHGTCCTCQDCGYSNEDCDCVCESNILNKLFDTMAKEADEYFIK